MLALLIQTLNITAPVFAMLFMGVLLKRIRVIDDNFSKVASSLVFNVCMPALLFLGIYHADLAAAVKPGVILYFIVATLVGFGLAWGLAIWRCPQAGVRPRWRHRRWAARARHRSRRPGR